MLLLDRENFGAKFVLCLRITSMEMQTILVKLFDHFFMETFKILGLRMILEIVWQTSGVVTNLFENPSILYFLSLSCIIICIWYKRFIACQFLLATLILLATLLCNSSSPQSLFQVKLSYPKAPCCVSLANSLVTHWMWDKDIHNQ